MKKSQDLQGLHQLQMVWGSQCLLFSIVFFSIVFFSLFSLFPFSTHCLFFSVCCFSHKYPHQCVSPKSIPTFHFPTCCIIVTPLHTNLQVASFQKCKRAFIWSTTEVSSSAWRALSRACIFYKWLCFVYSTVWNCIGCSGTAPLSQALNVWKQAQKQWCSSYC